MHASKKHATPLLTIAIPTYNRAPFLKETLTRLIAQWKELEQDDMIELYISNNCATDNTDEVVKDFIASGAIINYIVNGKNLGMSRNLYNCYQLGIGKFLWVLGDDDYLEPGALKKLLNYLQRNDDCGLISLWMMKRKLSEKFTILTDPIEGLKKISFFITFVSGCVVRRDCIQNVDAEYSVELVLPIMPYFMSAAVNSGKVLIIYDSMLEAGKNSATNGGYHLFNVFLNNYFYIWRKYIPGRFSYEIEKYKIFRYLLLNFICNRLLQKQEGNFDHNNGWRILMQYYGLYPYFYILLFGYVLKKLCGTVKRRFISK